MKPDDFLEEDDFIAVFQKRLKAERKERKLTQAEFATFLGVTKDIYKKIESRKGSACPIYLLPRIVHYTGKGYHYWCDLKPATILKLRAH